MPLTLTRTPTIYSLNQLDADEPGCPLAAPAKGVLSTPDKAVRELAGGASLLPLYTFPSADGFASKKVRSFGSFQDLAAAGGSGPAVPDVDEEGGLLGASDDDSLSQDGSSDSGTQVGLVGRGGVGRAGGGGIGQPQWDLTAWAEQLAGDECSGVHNCRTFSACHNQRPCIQPCCAASRAAHFPAGGAAAQRAGRAAAGGVGGPR